jgi:homoserine dehydrogenase
MKFGGSSLANADCFRRVCDITASSIGHSPVVVVSALGVEKGEIKVTDSLKEVGERALAGEVTEKLEQALVKRHARLIKELGLPGDLLDRELEKMRATVSGIREGKYRSKMEALDAIMGFGEILSSIVTASLLNRLGHGFSAVPAEGTAFITDDRFGNASVLDSSLEKIAASVIASKDMLVFPGYIGRTADGRMTTLGRGGSDYTAAVLGAALKKDVEIWTDVDGIYRIAPKYLPPEFKLLGHPETIPELSYEEAFQMAAFGSRVLYEKSMHAVQQAVRKGKHIRLLIKNTFNPGHPGTVVSSMHRHSGEPRGITVLEGTHLFTIYSGSDGENETFRREVTEQSRVKILLSSQTYGRLSLVLDDTNDELVRLESKYGGHLSRDQVLVKIVGDGLGENPVTLSRIHGALQASENTEKYGMTIVHKSPQILTDTTFELLAKKRGLSDVLLSLYKALFMEKTVTVGVLGLGTVGKGVLDYNKSMYSPEKGGFSLHFPKALVRDLSRDRGDLHGTEVTGSIGEILDNPTVDIVLEIMGGIEPARTYILEALKKGKDVVTANKALLAECGMEIFGTAFKYRRNIGFEASVCGEIPIIDDLLKFPGLGDIEGIEGIVNGTSNYVLTRFMEGMSMEAAIAEAQQKGFAEADPTLDVSGADASQKLSILASILFNQPVNYRDIPCQGLYGLLPVDRLAFVRWNMVVKPLALARLADGRLTLRVAPALVHSTHPLASVRDENNALALYLSGRKEPITNIGKGAGAIPTARSIIRDIIDVSRRSRFHMLNLPEFFRVDTRIPMASEGEILGNWYLRFTVADEPGVFGTIASILGECGLSIRQVIQEDSKDEGAHIQLEIKNSKLSSLESAVGRIKALPFVHRAFYCTMM